MHAIADEPNTRYITGYTCWMSYSLFIFDFDGTLADSADWVMRTFNDLAREHGFRSASDEELRMLRGRSNRDIVKYLGVPAWKLPAIATDARKRIARDIQQIKPFAGIEEMLAALKARGAMIAIVTSNSEENVRTILGPENAAHIDFYDCGASLFGKARKLRNVIAKARVTPARAICVGDETRDIEAAKEVGAASGAVTWGYATESILVAHAPTLLLRTMQDVVALAERAP
jgi:phosphoglycolate phosphatase